MGTSELVNFVIATVILACYGVYRIYRWKNHTQPTLRAALVLSRTERITKTAAIVIAVVIGLVCSIAVLSSGH